MDVDSTPKKDHVPAYKTSLITFKKLKYLSLFSDNRIKLQSIAITTTDLANLSKNEKTEYYE